MKELFKIVVSWIWILILSQLVMFGFFKDKFVEADENFKRSLFGFVSWETKFQVMANQGVVEMIDGEFFIDIEFY